MHLPSSSSSSSSELDSEEEFSAQEEIRITDSGVDSEQTSITTSSEVRVDAVQSSAFNIQLANQENGSQDEVSSVDSRNDIEEEIVYTRKSFFEGKKFSPSMSPAKSRPGSIVIPEAFRHESFASPKQEQVIQRKTGTFTRFEKSFALEEAQSQVQEVSSPGSSSSSDTVEENANYVNVSQEVHPSEDSYRKSSDVSKLTTMFEGLIYKNKSQNNTFLSWRSSNLSLKPKTNLESNNTPIYDDVEYESEMDSDNEEQEQYTSKENSVIEYFEPSLPSPPNSEPSSPKFSKRVSVVELRNKFTGEATSNHKKVKSIH